MSEQRNTLFVPERHISSSEEAFAAVVRQHINLVFATAMRQVGDRGGAEEITQNVFIALAQASDKLKSHPTIAGWLHRTTLNQAREWVRSELRRRNREQIAAGQDLIRSEGDSVWSPLVPLLDEALLGLREPDRLAIIMHFMEGQTFHEVASALGIGEDTARKRVDRCLDKLTQFFRRNGFAVPALTEFAPLFALSSHAAPAGLTPSVTSAGQAAVQTAASTSTSTTAFVKGALKIMAWTKTKSAIAVGIGILIVAGSATVAVVRGIEAPRTPAWQKKYDVSFIDKEPPQVTILPSVLSNRQNAYRAMGGHDGKGISLGETVPHLVMWAYGIGPGQLVWKAPVPSAFRYDLLANLPGGEAANVLAMQQAIQKKFGLVGHYETIKTNALILVVKFPHAPGVHRSSSSKSWSESEFGFFSVYGQPMSGLVNYLEQFFGIVIVDHTQWQGLFDFHFKWDGRTPNGLTQALRNQVGLELIPTNQPVQLLVVEKAK